MTELYVYCLLIPVTVNIRAWIWVIWVLTLSLFGGLISLISLGKMTKFSTSKMLIPWRPFPHSHIESCQSSFWVPLSFHQCLWANLGLPCSHQMMKTMKCNARKWFLLKLIIIFIYSHQVFQLIDILTWLYI